MGHLETLILFIACFQCAISGENTELTWGNAFNKFVAESIGKTGCSMDVMFVLDGSGSIRSDDFNRVKQWVKGMAKRIAELHTDIQLGVLQYSHFTPSLPLSQQPYIRTEVELSYYNRTDFDSTVDNVEHMRFTTYTAAALRRVKFDFLNSTNFGKPGNIQIMILLTDGRASDFGDLPQSAADLRQIGVIPHVFGVGRYSLTELAIIATGNRSRLERVEAMRDFSRFPSATVDLKQYLDVCEESGTTDSAQTIPMTVEPQTLPEKVGSGCLVDVIFVLDGSASIGTDNFDVVKQWVTTLAGRMIAMYPRIQLGVMQYSHFRRFLPLRSQPSIKMEVPLDYHKFSDFVAAVGNITYMSQTTYTAAALKSVKYDFLNSKNFNKSENTQIMILLTDGSASDAQDLAQSATELRNVGIIPVVYGVGAVDVSELRTIATGNPSSSDRVSVLGDFRSLQAVQFDLAGFLKNC